MSCDHCCGADKLFDLKSAEKEKNKYLKKGAKGVTHKLMNEMSAQSFQAGRLLDIGGGIGILQWHFLNGGGNFTTQVDASSGYLQVAQELADDQGYSDQSSFLFGDFLDVADQIEPHDWVTLDKVVCCYPDFESLLQTAASKSSRYLALTFPMGGPVAKAFSSIGALWMRIKNNPFRPYIHPRKEIEQTLEAAGFTALSRSTKFPWHVQVYRRN